METNLIRVIRAIRAIRAIRGGRRIESVTVNGHSEIMKIKAIIHEPEEGGFEAEVPALSGCSAQGVTVEELTENHQRWEQSH